MAASTGAHVENTASIATSGDSAYGMFAQAFSSALNTGEITTSGSGSYGMAADFESTALNLAEDSIVTWGDGAHGMVATASSSADNAGSITTHGEGAFGMMAEDGSAVENFASGTIVTTMTGSIGMVASDDSRADNAGSISTDSSGSHGMAFLYGSGGYNYGSIVTSGESAYGMYAAEGSEATNSGMGSIETFGIWGDGMVAVVSSDVANYGDIVTHGNQAVGMAAFAHSTAENTVIGSIVTSGDSAFGMYGENVTELANAGTIVTSGDLAHGMVAVSVSTAENTGEITTFGDNARGMQASLDSTISNLGADSIVTWGESAYGMMAMGASSADNSGSVTTHGDKAIGVYAHDHSEGENSGSITTYGDQAMGMRADETSILLNSGSIVTSGDGAHGMEVVEYSRGVNTGTIATSGTGAHAARVDFNGDFANSGTLDSLNGYALLATNASQVSLWDGTVLAGSHALVGDETSSLEVAMDGSLSAQVSGFGSFTKNHTGWMRLEGLSWAHHTQLNGGALEIGYGNQFWTESYLQDPGTILFIYASPAVPLIVSGDANMSGTLMIDLSGVPLPGAYTYIDAGSYTDNFDTEFANNYTGLWDPYLPQWFSEGGREYYRGMIGYAFSEQALGLVSAIQDWSLLRWVMGNHMADVADGFVELGDGERSFHFQGLYGKTERDPAGGSPAGFDATQSGVSLGFDQKVDEQTSWGLYAGYTKNELDITHVFPAAGDWENQETWHFGGYVLYRAGNWILTDSLTYRKTDHESFRRQINENATGDFDSWSITNDFRAGYVAKDIDENSKWQVVPEIGFNYGHINRDGYEEENGFEYGDFDATVWEGVLGVRFRGEFAREDGSKWVPQARVSWVHLLSGDDITLTQDWYGDTHEYTELLDDDYLVVDLGFALYTAGDTEISLNYNGRFGDSSESHGAWLRYRMTF
jgi:hypothetical protein